MTDKQLTLIDGGREVEQYDPDQGLKEVAISEAAEKHWRRAKNADQLYKAIEAKLLAQAEYVVWRDRTVNPKGGGGPKQRRSTRTLLPDSDPGRRVVERWRKRLCCKAGEGSAVDATKVEHEAKRAAARIARTIIDPTKLQNRLDDAHRRSVRVCEQQKAGVIRGTEGTGEFERYTPAKYIEAARMVLGEIDLDPSTSEEAQQTVRALQYFTAADDGLVQEWNGRVFLNPPYHRDLAPKFIDKLVTELTAGRVTAAILLTNNCTDTDWFDDAVRACAGICFTHGRIRFHVPKCEDVLPTQGQSFLYFGKDVQRFEDVFCVIGFCVCLSRAYEPGCITTHLNGNEAPPHPLDIPPCLRRAAP
jgi:hypothetical protein